MPTFGEKLRQLRTQRGLTLRALARELGYTNAHAYINDFENGKRRPTLDFVVKIGKYFNVSVDLLIRDDIELNLGDTEDAPRTDDSSVV